MAGTTNGTCTWTFGNGVWTAVDNCAAGFTCTGPLPLGLPGAAPEHGVDANGDTFMSDHLLRATARSLNPGITIPVSANGNTVTLPCH
jgi:hypothetical protein